MRLIDADEVKKAFVGNRYGTKAIEYVIDNAPTVKAIPVEYIEAFKREVRNVTDAKAVIDWLLEELPLVIDEIVRIWEKENE